MKELFDELRLRDFLVIIILLGVVAMMTQSGMILNWLAPKHNPADYQFDAIATISSIKPKFDKKETLQGSKFKQIGYDLEISYSSGGERIEQSMHILYDQYKISKYTIDSLINNSRDGIRIKVRKDDVESIILKTETGE